MLYSHLVVLIKYNVTVARMNLSNVSLPILYLVKHSYSLAPSRPELQCNVLKKLIFFPTLNSTKMMKQLHALNFTLDCRYSLAPSRPELQCNVLKKLIFFPTLNSTKMMKQLHALNFTLDCRHNNDLTAFLEYLSERPVLSGIRKSVILDQVVDRAYIRIIACLDF